MIRCGERGNLAIQWHISRKDSRCMWVTNILFTFATWKFLPPSGWSENCRRVPSAPSITVDCRSIGSQSIVTLNAQKKDEYSIMNHLRQYQVQERSNCVTRKGHLRKKCQGNQRTSVVTCLVRARCYCGTQRHYGEDKALDRKSMRIAAWGLWCISNEPLLNDYTRQRLKKLWECRGRGRGSSTSVSECDAKTEL